MNDKLIRSLRDHPVKYAHLLGFNLLTDLHNEWIKLMLMEPHDYTLLGHRGSYKTTCLSIAFALLIVLRPDKTIFFIRKTDDDVIEIIRQTLKILESDLFHYLVSEIYGIDLVITTSTSFKIDTNLNDSSKGQVQLLGMGLNGSLTGKHADLVFTDDIVNVKDRASRAEREQTKRQYQELQNIKNRGGRIFNTGTPWHKEDCISTLMPNINRWTCYDTGLISKDNLTQLRESMSASLFAANYELKHIADKDAMFKDAHYLTDDEDTAETLYEGIAHIDAAYGGEDFTAYTVMHELPDGHIAAFGKIWQQHVDECLSEIILYHEYFRAGSIVCETNGDKGYLKQELEDDLGMYVCDYSEHTNKFIKISSYLKKNWNRIYWISDTDPEYINQITDYTEFSEHDDAPDSAASLIRYLIEKPEANTDECLAGGW